MLPRRERGPFAVSDGRYETKESAWWKPGALFLLAGAKVIIVIVSAVVVMFLLWRSWWTYRPDLLINPIDRAIHLRYLAQGDKMRGFTASLIPEVFTVGESGPSASRQLKDAGYWWNGGEGGTVDFRKDGPGPQFLCQTIYLVTLSLDGQGNLSAADVSASSYCV